MKRTGSSEQQSATPSSSTNTIESGKETGSAASQDRSSPVTQLKVYSKAASTTARPMLADNAPGAAPPGPDRREHYTERGPQPSFEFADIDDEQVLKVEAEQRLAMQPVLLASPRQTEQARRLSEIAGAIKKMMEGEVASVIKELARLQAQEGAGQADLQEVKKGFSLFIKHFQQAKLSAAEAKQNPMTEALGSALEELARLARQAGDKSAGQVRATRTFRTEVQPHLQSLAAACSAWAGVDNPLSKQVPAPDRDDTDSQKCPDPEARARSASIPAPVRPSQERERARSVSSRTSSSGKVPAGMAHASPATTGKDEMPKSPSSPGRKLKAFFSRSSEPRSSKSTADSDPGSPHSRSGAKRSAESSTTTTSTATTTTSTRAASVSRADKKRDAND